MAERPLFRCFAFCLVLLCAALNVRYAHAAAHDTFNFLAPSPTGNTINDIWTPDGSTYYFVGDGGVILKYDGTSFTQMESPTWCSLNGVSGTSSSDIWAVGGCEYGYDITNSNRSVILHYNGTAWSKVTPPVDGFGQYLVFTDVWAANSNLVYASAAGTTYLARRNGGAFSYLDTGLGGLYGQFNGVYGFASNDVYAAGTCGQVVHYNGTAWSLERTEGDCSSISFQLLYNVWGPDSANVFVVGNSEMLLQRNSGSGAWTTRYSDGSFGGVSLNALSGTAANDMYIVGNAGQVSRWNGSAYSDVLTSGPLQKAVSRRGASYLIGGEYGFLASLSGGSRTVLGTAAPSSNTWEHVGRTVGKGWVSGRVINDGEGPYTWNGSQLQMQGLGIAGQTWVRSLSTLSNGEVWLGLVPMNTSTPIVKVYSGGSWTTRDLGDLLLDAVRTPSGQYFVILGSYWQDDLVGYTGQPCLLGSSWVCYSGTDFRSLAVGTNGKVYAVGMDGKVASYSGGAWSVENSGTVKDLLAVAAGGSRVCAVGRDRAAVCKADGGAWVAATGIATKTGNAFIDIAANSSGEFYAVLNTGNDEGTNYEGANKGTIYRIYNGAGSVVEGEMSTTLGGVAVSSDDQFFFAGSGGVLYGDPIAGGATCLPGVISLLLD